MKLALAIGAGSEGGVHSHCRRALEEGVPREALKQVASLAIPTLGFPRAVAALTWIEDVTEGSPARPSRGRLHPWSTTRHRAVAWCGVRSRPPDRRPPTGRFRPMRRRRAAVPAGGTRT